MITIKSRQEVVKLRRADRIVADAIAAVAVAVRPGISTAELDRIAHDVILGAGARPSFKGYAPNRDQPPYPATICAARWSAARARSAS